MGTALAVQAETDGDLGDAAVRYGEAAAGWSAYGHVLEHGLALLGAGRCLVRLGASRRRRGCGRPRRSSPASAPAPGRGGR